MRCGFPSNCAPLDIFYSCSLQPFICTLLTCSSTSLKPPYRNFLVLPLCWAPVLLLPSLPDLLWGTQAPQCLWEWKHGLLWGYHLGTGARTHCDPLPWLGPLPMRHPFRAPGTHVVKFLWEACTLTSLSVPLFHPLLSTHFSFHLTQKTRCHLPSFPLSLPTSSLREELLGGRISPHQFSPRPPFSRNPPPSLGHCFSFPSVYDLLKSPNLITEPTLLKVLRYVLLALFIDKDMGL